MDAACIDLSHVQQLVAAWDASAVVEYVRTQNTREQERLWQRAKYSRSRMGSSTVTHLAAFACPRA
eukprot:5927851-Alexandrium_andersonii.AAC.1